jgi:hypothetical protein
VRFVVFCHAAILGGVSPYAAAGSVSPSP